MKIVDNCCTGNGFSASRKSDAALLIARFYIKCVVCFVFSACECVGCFACNTYLFKFSVVSFTDIYVIILYTVNRQPVNCNCVFNRCYSAYVNITRVKEKRLIRSITPGLWLFHLCHSPLYVIFTSKLHLHTVHLVNYELLIGCEFLGISAS